MKILIADDDGLIRDSLKFLISSTDGFVVETAENGEAAINKAQKFHPDVILMDIRMPIVDGVEATILIKEKYPDIKIIMLTTFLDDGYIASAINAGAEGYLLKSTSADGIIERIRAVAKGANVFDSEVMNHLTAKKKNPIFDELTERENEVLTLVAQGLSNSEIADKLYISGGTVRNVVSTILNKTLLRDRTQLAVWYWKNTTS